MPIITLDDVRYRYPEAGAPALHGISARVEPGAVILVRGPSGSGKSTLLRCLNGLVPHSTGGAFSGRVIVCGLDTRTQLPRELGTRIGFVFQHPDAQFVLEDVEAELAFGLENLGLGRSLMRKRIEEVIAEHRVERIAPFVNRIGTHESGSMQDQAPRAAGADGGARPPVVDLAIRAGWAPIPLGLRDARIHTTHLPTRTPSAPAMHGTGEVMCRLEGVAYAYDGVRAVAGASLMLRRGQVTALMGRNASGKTTLLKLIAGVLRPQRGHIKVHVRAAYVPQDADALLFA